MRRRLAMELALALIVVGLVVLAVGLVRGRRGAVAAPGSIATVEFLDVGQGDSILIRSPEGKNALIDAGPSRSAVVGLLRSRGITSLDLVVISHHHADHYGGMAEVIRAFHPRVFLDADSPHATRLYVALLQLVQDEGMTAIRPSPDRPRKLALGSVTLTVLPQPPIRPSDDENDNSVGIRVEYGDFSSLLTGDSQAIERRWWLDHAAGLCSGVQILKLAHHGSRNGVDRRWLEWASPRLAVASLGSGNDFGHPHPETLALLRSMGIPLLRTDLSGSVAIRTDGRTWSVLGPTHVARGPPAPTSDPADDRVRRASGAIRLNSATEAELRDLPGIGPKLAREIIAHRPYRSVDELAEIPNFGRKRMETLRPFATAR